MVGNWKLNLDHNQAIQLVQKLAWTLGDAKHDYDAVEVVVSPSFTNLRSVQTLVDGDKLSIKYASQDVSAHASGAYTGEISAEQLAKLGGLGEAQIDACLADKDLENAILQARLDGEQKYKINSTPSFIIDGRTVSGEQSVDAFAAMIDPLLPK